MSFSYRWQRCNSGGGECSNLNATAQTYKPVKGDIGHTLRVSVTASNSDGSANAVSAPTTVVTDGSPVEHIAADDHRNHQAGRRHRDLRNLERWGADHVLLRVAPLRRFGRRMPRHVLRPDAAARHGGRQPHDPRRGPRAKPVRRHDRDLCADRRRPTEGPGAGLHGASGDHRLAREGQT
jgi:hypothetical protein